MMNQPLIIWTITHNTKDFGDKWVARPTIVPNEHPNMEDGYLIADTLEELRDKLPPGLSRLQRDPNDDPVIVEVWL
jgi:hypothetical protein